MHIPPSMGRALLLEGKVPVLQASEKGEHLGSTGQSRTENSVSAPHMLHKMPKSDHPVNLAASL